MVNLIKFLDSVHVVPASLPSDSFPSLVSDCKWFLYNSSRLCRIMSKQLFQIIVVAIFETLIIVQTEINSFKLKFTHTVRYNTFPKIRTNFFALLCSVFFSLKFTKSTGPVICTLSIKIFVAAKLNTF